MPSSFRSLAVGATTPFDRRATRAPREVPPPTWHRAFRRGGMMGGLMMVAFLFLFKNGSVVTRFAFGLFYAIAFIPLTYWIDRVAHRSYLRRSAAAKQPNPKS